MGSALTYAQLLGIDDCYKQRVRVSEHLLHSLIRRMLPEIEFDERWYLDINRDVATAVKHGQFASGFAHYVEVGYFENRPPRNVQVEAEWYLAAYPKVASLIQDCRFSSAQDHFNEEGFRTGLLPFAEWKL